MFYVFTNAVSNIRNVECVFLDDPSRGLNNQAHICWPDHFDDPGFSFSQIGGDLGSYGFEHDHFTAKRCVQLWNSNVHFCYPAQLYLFEYHTNGIPESWTDFNGVDLSEYCMEMGWNSDNYLCGFPTRGDSYQTTNDKFACDICPVGFESNPGSDQCYGCADENADWMRAFQTLVDQNCFEYTTCAQTYGGRSCSPDKIVSITGSATALEEGMCVCKPGFMLEEKSGVCVESCP